MLSHFKNVEKSLSKGNRNRASESVKLLPTGKYRILPERKSLHEDLEKEAERTVQGECAAQKRLSEAQVEVDRGEWERRNADIALCETTRHLESQRVELYQANQRADQAQREKSWLLGELDTRNKRLSGRSRKKLPRTWRLTQKLLVRSWKSSSIEVWWALYATEWESFYSESAFSSDSGIAGQGEFLERCTRIRWSWNSEQHWIIACSLIHGNHWVHQETLEGLLGTYWVPHETFLKIYLLDTGHPQHSCKTQRIWHHLLADWSQLVQVKLLNKSKNWEEPQDCTIPTPRFARSHGTWNPLYRTGGTYNQNCTMENPRNRSSDLHFDYFPDPEDFQCWKVNFKTEVSSHWGCPTIAMLWIKEVEIAKSVDDLVTSQTIEGRDFNPLEWLMRQRPLDWRGSSLISTSEESQCRRAACSKARHFFFTNKTDYFHDLWPFSSNWSLWCSSRPIRPLKGFLARRWHSRFRNKMGSSFIISKWNTQRKHPGRFVQVENTRFCSASVCVGIVRTRDHTKQRTTLVFQNEDISKTSCWSEDEDAKLQSPERNSGKRSSNQETQKGRKASAERKESVRKETRVFFVMIPSLETDATQTDGNKPQKSSFPTDISLKSESGCTYGEKCRFRLVEVDRQSSEKSKKSGVKGSIAFFWKSLLNWVVCLKILSRIHH